MPTSPYQALLRCNDCPLPPIKFVRINVAYPLLSMSLATTLFAGCSANSSEDTTTSISNSAQSSESTHPVETGPKGELPGGSGGGGFGGGSIDTSNIKIKYIDVAYDSQSDTQKLDIYLPNEGEAPFPVIIALHGGGFMLGNKTGGDLTSTIKGVEHGYAVVSVDYRLSGEAVFPAAISDVKAAIRYIKANAEKYNLDPDKIAVWGDSAGGNLAALAGTSGDVDNDFLNGDNTENLDYTSEVQAVVDWFGPLEFTKMDEQFEASGITPMMGTTNSDSSAESKYIGGNVAENEELAQKANPANYISENDPYFFIEHGTEDANVPTQQSIDFAEKLQKVIGENKVTLTLLEGAKHGGEQFDTDDNLKKVFNFFDGVLK
ncbi:alpha/beta hydrolase fold domain-containing protein [Lysinibacillus sp. NPDC097287]|uniref:alpha/beta hydrolase fold domain-containing protein n=1 Tax=Lysinibacillus sp. NPDC097287 TaxID=3364144 RepID=UPI0038035611